MLGSRTWEVRVGACRAGWGSLRGSEVVLLHLVPPEGPLCGSCWVPKVPSRGSLLHLRTEGGPTAWSKGRSERPRECLKEEHIRIWLSSVVGGRLTVRDDVVVHVRCHVQSEGLVRTKRISVMTSKGGQGRERTRFTRPPGRTTPFSVMLPSLRLTTRVRRNFWASSIVARSSSFTSAAAC